ncbi:probable polygalacturonase At3g15720 [Impatiens glandulifera]|uniref:probable polygalacturonase At3g15720 n=1 Tax=Impatiens glandulifera TaxID=253017 RepID=UPI001FB190DF|nr:probable polygalacturonase At3g15720 [Impatiens glandulifera]
MQSHLGLFFLFCIFYLDICLAITFDVRQYGAVGNGNIDDSKAFLQAWKATCACTSDTAVMVVPAEKTFFIRSLLFSGPCISQSPQIQIDGTLIAPDDINKWTGCASNTWIMFSQINGLNIYGEGKLNGNGLPWWQGSNLRYLHNNNFEHSFQYKYPRMGSCSRPTAMRFSQCNNLEVKGLTHINPPRNHISINDCNNVKISEIKIIAPEHSPNTDGIDISSSTNIHIMNSIIRTGDDCVAINNKCSNIIIEGVQCGPGHGLSVGSLGKGGDYAQVEGILVKNCTLTRTTNGARIKTWPGGNGYARNITFENILLHNTKNPIIIDQHYCNTTHCAEQMKAVKVSNVNYINIQGTSVTKHAILLDCSTHVPCTDIVFKNVNIKSISGEKTYSTMNNAIFDPSPHPRTSIYFRSSVFKLGKNE